MNHTIGFEEAKVKFNNVVDCLKGFVDTYNTYADDLGDLHIVVCAEEDTTNHGHCWNVYRYDTTINHYYEVRTDTTVYDALDYVVNEYISLMDKVLKTNLNKGI